MVQHNRVLTNDPIASVILWKPFFFFFCNSTSVYQIAGWHWGWPHVPLAGWASFAADYSVQADQITERLAMASYPQPSEMIFHCHNSLD